MRSNITEWRAACASPIIRRIASNFPIASECGAISFNASSKVGNFNRQFVSSGYGARHAVICRTAAIPLSLFPNPKLIAA
ncbi:hypothetical protein [Burkholderia arboris]|uniref:hypothetical protein n=1 Tax=Burkholderia arboris TaxID=488730 RepID=UPI0030F32AF9